MAIRGIYGEPYKSMDHLVDLESMIALHDDIVYGLAKSELYLGMLGDYVIEKDKYYDCWSEELRIMKLPDDDPIKKRLLSLNYHQKKVYTKLLSKCYNSSFVCMIRYVGRFDDKHKVDKTTWHPRNKDNFPSLIKWIYDQNVFESIGRILLYVSEHHLPLPAHKDNEFKELNKNETLWFQTRPDKQMYILDPATKERHYFKHLTAFFSDADYHGFDALPFMTFSVRVDGVFTKATRTALGIPADDPWY